MIFIDLFDLSFVFEIHLLNLTLMDNIEPFDFLIMVCFDLSDQRNLLNIKLVDRNLLFVIKNINCSCMFCFERVFLTDI